jgi:hypothetical protein
MHTGSKSLHQHTFVAQSCMGISMNMPELFISFCVKYVFELDDWLRWFKSDYSVFYLNFSVLPISLCKYSPLMRAMSNNCFFFFQELEKNIAKGLTGWETRLKVKLLLIFGFHVFSGQ